MSYYRESPPHYSRRSPARVERDIIEDEINLKNALRSEAENRRLVDEISLLQIRVRKTEELENKVDSLIKQNSMLSQDNDQLARELAERRYELERVKVR
jgi:FtsZ-binding cell division protein ZapB